MKFTKIHFYCIVILICLLYHPVNVFSCGPFFPKAIFVVSSTPEISLDQLLKGKLGIIQSQFSDEYLYIAYSYFKGKSFTAAQREIIRSAFENDSVNEPWQNKAQEDWLNERRKVTNSDINLMQDDNVYNEKYHAFYININNDAFRTATKTLQERIDRFGAQSEAVVEWLKAQDMVFCSYSRQIPPPNADSHLPELIQKDRAYQIAASQFYMGHFPVAESLFRNISLDKSSPWNKLARYLVARTLIRRATITTTNDGAGSNFLLKAEKLLQEVLSDSSMKEFQPAAERLYHFCMFRTDPKKIFTQLNSEIFSPINKELFKDEWTDYDRLMNTSNDSSFVNRFDFPDWMNSFSTHDDYRITEPSAYDHSYQRWKKTHSIPWLIAALASDVHLLDGHPDLLQSADSIPPSSRAYPTVMFYKTRLLLASASNAGAQKIIDSLLTRKDVHLSRLDSNWLLTKRASFATDLDDFIRRCWLKPIGYEIDGDFSSGAGDEDLFTDSATVLNWLIPVHTLYEECMHANLPPRLRRSLARATWVRAVLLGDTSTALQLIPVLKELSPEMKPLLEQYEPQQTDAERTFVTAYILLHWPGAQPYVRICEERSEYISGKPADIRRIDDYRDNWWCAGDRAVEATKFDNWKSVVKTDTSITESPYSFLTINDIAIAHQEITTLIELPAAPDYLGDIVCRWAMSHPRDPRVPKALHLEVRATRYGCGDSLTTSYSKKAYTILHNQYPSSSWTAKTKFWF